MTPKSDPPFDTSAIVDQLYDIALEPKTLDAFIDAWNEAGLDARTARQAITHIDQFDTAYQAHLERAGTFLTRGQHDSDSTDLIATLAPFDNLAAFIVNSDMHIEACNDGAETTFAAATGAHIDTLKLPPEAEFVLNEGLNNVFETDGPVLKLLNVDSPSKTGPALFQFRKIVAEGPSDKSLALVVSTQYHWQDLIGTILEDVFNLTVAEQGIVRGLVEGLAASALASKRGTSEGTVRGQIKSVMAKMNARSQSEIIRLVLSLRDISEGSQHQPSAQHAAPTTTSANWLQAEVWKPLNTLILPDGRKMDFHEVGPITGRPVLLSHMGYCLTRLHTPIVKAAYRHSLRMIIPIRAGYGDSDNLDPKADVILATRQDTLALLDHLDIARLPYVAQGSDLLWAADFAAHHPEKISEIIGLCARPSLPGDQHYAGMGKWHRFFLSTGKHAPHLLSFTTKAAMAMAKRIGPLEMFKQMNKSSAADLALANDPEFLPVLIANADFLIGGKSTAAQAYTMEVLESEADWSDLMLKAKDTKTWFINGAQDPATDIATIAEYRETYPWIDIDVIPDAGQMLLVQHFNTVIPRLAEAAHRA